MGDLQSDGGFKIDRPGDPQQAQRVESREQDLMR
jgi:hypothetical protein